MTAPLPPDARRFLESFRFGSERAWDDDADVCDAAVGPPVMVLGDIHGDSGVFDAALKLAAAEECDVVVQVGDFWLEDSTSSRWVPKRIARLMYAALRSPVPVVVVDGNHEVWPCLTAWFRGCDDAVAARRAGRGLFIWAVRCGGLSVEASGAGAAPGSVRSAGPCPQTNGSPSWPSTAGGLRRSPHNKICTASSATPERALTC